MTDVVTMVETPVRSVDMDADRVVNNAVYFMYFEQARLAHLQRLRSHRQAHIAPRYRSWSVGTLPNPARVERPTEI